MRISLAITFALAACSADPPLEPDLTPEARPAIAAAGAAPTQVAPHSEPGINPRILRRFSPLAPLAPMTPTEALRVDLGRMLFFDKRLSKKHNLSCNSCHRLDKYGVDHEPTSIGTNGKRGRRNSPSVYFASAHFTSLWDGRAKDVEEQAKKPILNPDEMGMESAQGVMTVVASIPGYVDAFKAAFPDQPSPVTYDNLGAAIGAFERRLVTPSRWDRYLEGDRSALTPAEVVGLKAFTDVGCMTCHTGQLVGGSMFQKAGFVKPWTNQSDQGRFELTGLEADKMLFKVPSLRNVAMTAPYFHDASAKTLDEAVRSMGVHQLEDPLADEDVASIVVWLGSMTGEIPTAYIAEPALPPDGPMTPKIR